MTIRKYEVRSTKYELRKATFRFRSPQTSYFVLRTCLCLLLCAGAAAAAGRPITTTDLLALHRISDPQISPDGTRVLYTVAVPDVAANRTARNVWVVTVA